MHLTNGKRSSLFMGRTFSSRWFTLVSIELHVDKLAMKMVKIYREQPTLYVFLFVVYVWIVNVFISHCNAIKWIIEARTLTIIRSLSARLMSIERQCDRSKIVCVGFLYEIERKIGIDHSYPQLTLDAGCLARVSSTSGHIIRIHLMRAHTDALSASNLKCLRS